MSKEFGLIGFPLSHSFSREFFLQKFSKENINNIDYQLFPIKSIEELPLLLTEHPLLEGLNVTHPYKTQIIPTLDAIDEEAFLVGAVNTIKIERNDNQIRLIGFNTDIIGFEKSYKELISSHQQALILGSGGAAKAVAYVLTKMGIHFQIISRNPQGEQIDYSSITPELLKSRTLIINATPAGMAPFSNTKPDIPYEHLTSKHLLIDLIYNPAETLFLAEGKRKGAQIKNGEKMLAFQAEASWKIWNGFL